MRPWIAFFSQTGTEIHNLTHELDMYPDCIVTNKQDHSTTNRCLITTAEFRQHKLNLHNAWCQLSKSPTVEEYKSVIELFHNPVITLHGYLRIIPKEICEKYEIYNLHPGLIDKYPSLKGFNPQERAFKEGYKFAGCVIHRVVPEVDAGKIILSQGISIEDKNLQQVYESLHDVALDLWKSFFTAFNILQK